MEKRFTWRAVILIAVIMIGFEVCLINWDTISGVFSVFKEKNEANYTKEYGVFIGMTGEDDYSSLSKYQTIVIDAQLFTKEQISELKDEGHTVYSYLNIGSLEEFRDYYDDFKDICLGEYEGWDGEYWIDVSNNEWGHYITDTLAVQLSSKGVDGFFVDNLDVYDNYRYEGIYDGLVAILKRLKGQCQNVIVNGGDTFISVYVNCGNDLSTILSAINQENVFTTFDENGSLSETDEETREYFESYLEGLDTENITVYLLEYTSDDNVKSDIISYCVQNNFKYYITDDYLLGSS